MESDPLPLDALSVLKAEDDEACLTTVKSLHSAGVRFRDLKDADNSNLLHIACARGLKKTANFLISNAGRGQSLIPLMDNSRQTPLHCAANANQPEILESLLLAGADASIADAIGQIPLHKAAIVGASQCVALLLDEGDVEVDYTDNDGKTALFYAATNQFKETAALLANKGADQSILLKALKDKFGSHNFVGHDWPEYNGKWMSSKEGRDFPLRK